MVFAELYWTPALLLQAEDRVHRIGQNRDVLISYIIAMNTLDDLMWPVLASKLKAKCNKRKNFYAFWFRCWALPLMVRFKPCNLPPWTTPMPPNTSPLTPLWSNRATLKLSKMFANDFKIL